MLDAYDRPNTDKPQLTRDDLRNMRPQDVDRARKEGRLRDLMGDPDSRRVGPQGKDWR